MEFEVPAVNTDLRSSIQSRVGKQVLEHYRTRTGGLDDVFQRVKEDTLVYGIGFILQEWDQHAGEEKDADPKTGEILYEGDVTYDRIPLYDVIANFEDVKEWRDQPWVAVRMRRNRFDLKARYPEFGTQIDTVGPDEDLDAHEGERSDFSEDFVDEFIFYHKPCPAIPSGRLIRWIGEDAAAIVEDIALPYKEIPVYSICPEPLPNTCLGWSPLFNIQAGQEMLSELTGKLATTFDILGYPVVWTRPGTNRPNPMEWVGAISQIQSEEPPQLIDLMRIPDGIFTTIEWVLNAMRNTVGVNIASEGQAAGSVRSNSMQLFAAEQQRRFSSAYHRAFRRLFGEIGEGTLRILQEFPQGERVLKLAGKRNRGYVLKLNEDSLVDVAGVSVRAGNSLTNTVEGRLEMLQVLGQLQVDLNLDNVVSIVEGAPLEAVTEDAQAKADRIREENEALLEGGTHVPIASDDHMADIQGHAALLNSPEMRGNPGARDAILAAIFQHWQLYNTPGIYDLQVALGQADVPPAMLGAMGAGPAGGASQASGGPPSEAQQAAVE